MALHKASLARGTPAHRMTTFHGQPGRAASEARSGRLFARKVHIDFTAGRRVRASKIEIHRPLLWELATESSPSPGLRRGGQALASLIDFQPTPGVADHRFFDNAPHHEADGASSKAYSFAYASIILRTRSHDAWPSCLSSNESAADADFN